MTVVPAQTGRAASGWELAAPEARWPAHLPSVQVDGERLLLPSFDGRGLANVAPTAMWLLAPEARGHTTLPPLATAALPPALLEGVRALVVLLADGLGHLQLQREAAAGCAPTLARLLRQAADGAPGVAYTPITSVFPTTTVAALGCINSGATPAEHGLLGYTSWLDEFQAVGELIRWGPLDRRGSYADAALGAHQPEHFFWAQTLYHRLQAAGVARTFAVNPSHFAQTALTRMLHQGATYAGYAATSSLAVMVPRLLRQQPPDAPTYIYAYWPTVDTVSHLSGPDSEEHAAEVAAFDRALELLLERLPARGSTLLLLTADHGHVPTSVQQQVSLNAYPDLLGLLRAYPAGERRVTYLYALPGQAERLEDLSRQRLGEVAAVLSRAGAERLGLFGPGSLPPRAAARVGDVLLFPRGNVQLAFELPTDPSVPESERPTPARPFCGLHGGLTPEEVLVPLLALRL